MSAKAKGRRAVALKKRPVPAGTPVCSHCGQFAWRARSSYMREIARGILLASVVRYLSEEQPPVCNKCIGEVRRLREWRAKRGAA